MSVGKKLHCMYDDKLIVITGPVDIDNRMTDHIKQTDNLWKVVVGYHKERISDEKLNRFNAANCGFRNHIGFKSALRPFLQAGVIRRAEVTDETEAFTVIDTIAEKSLIDNSFITYLVIELPNSPYGEQLKRFLNNPSYKVVFETSGIWKKYPDLPKGVVKAYELTNITCNIHYVTGVA